MRAQIDSEDLPADRHSVLVMRNCRPIGAPGFPEWGHIPIPRVLLRQEVTDVVRISDARMSGTSFGTVVLHMAPDSAIGGRLAVVRTGNEIELDCLEPPDRDPDSVEQLQRRIAAFQPSPPKYDRDYGWLFLQHVTQALRSTWAGCDFDFLQKTPR